MEQRKGFGIEPFGQSCDMYGTLYGCQYFEQVVRIEHSFAGCSQDMRANIMGCLNARVTSKLDQLIGFGGKGKTTARLLQIGCRL